MSLSNDPSVAVTVCAALPLLEKVSVPPTANRKLAGVKPLSLIAMDPVLGPAAATDPDPLAAEDDAPPVIAAGAGALFAGAAVLFVGGAAAGGALPSAARAMTVPVMLGWISQKYVNVPAVANVCDHDVAFFNNPLANDWSSAVTVCVTVSPLDQVMVLPTLTVIVDGTKELLLMVIDSFVGVAPGPGTGRGDATGGAGGVGCDAGGTGAGAGGTGAGAGAGLPAAVTMTVPRMLPWKSQPYGYVPGAVNVWANVAAEFSAPLSKEASSAVTECFDASLFVQVTVPPTATVTVAGENCAPAR
jgi:hypothetical protein